MHVEMVQQSDGLTERPLGCDDIGNMVAGLVALAKSAIVTPAVTVGAYASGAVVGGVMSFTVFRLVNGSGILDDIFITDKGNKKPPLTLLFFEHVPGQTYTDNVACPTIAADVGFLVGQALIAAADYTTTGAIAIAHKTLLGLNLQNADTTGTKKILYCVAVVTAAYTPLTVSDLTFRCRMRQN